MRDLWRALVADAKRQFEEMSRGASYRPRRRAYADIIRVASDANADDVILTVAAMWHLFGIGAVALRVRRRPSGSDRPTVSPTQRPACRRDLGPHRQPGEAGLPRCPRLQLVELGLIVSVGLGAACLTVVKTMSRGGAGQGTETRAYQRLECPSKEMPTP